MQMCSLMAVLSVHAARPLFRVAEKAGVLSSMRR